MNRKRIIALALTPLLVLLLAFGTFVHGAKLLRKVGTDLGGFSGDSDYGDSDSGWSSSSDSGWSSSSDSDWGRSSGRTSSMSSDSPKKENPILDFFGFIIGYGSLFLWIRMMIRDLWAAIDGGERQTAEEQKWIQEWRQRAKASPLTGGLPAGAERTPSSRLSPVSWYAALDPSFSESDLKQQLSDLYVRMQQGCTARNIEDIRPWFSDGLYQQFDRQLKDLIAKRRINRVEDIEVLSVELRGYFLEGNEDHLVAELKTRIVDYTVNEDTDELVSGSRTARKHMTYEWDLSRPSDARLKKAGADKERCCPNCGGALEANETAKCPYCGAVVTFRDHDWTLYAVKGIAQRTERP